MQNRLSLHLILREIWLTPTVRTNRPTAKNTCQWSDHACIRRLGVDKILPSALLLSANTMSDHLRCMQQLPREFYDTSSLHRDSEFTTDGSHPTRDRTRPLSTFIRKKKNPIHAATTFGAFGALIDEALPNFVVRLAPCFPKLVGTDTARNDVPF